MNLACSGLAPNAKKDDWLKLAGDNDRLQRGMARLYALFKDAPVLGSLINPRAGGGDLLEAEFHELQPLLEKALAQETKDDTAHEMAVTARGLAKAAEILAGQFTLVATNVPYLGRAKQDEVLKELLRTRLPRLPRRSGHMLCRTLVQFLFALRYSGTCNAPKLAVFEGTTRLREDACLTKRVECYRRAWRTRFRDHWRRGGIRSS